jgi:uncharacterized protein (TIGR03435 family)
MLDINLGARRTATRKILLCLTSLIFVVVKTLYAQIITGTWQGTLPITENPRIVLKIAKADDGSLHGGFIQIDRSASGMQLSSVTFVAPDLTVSQIYANISYQGKLSADGKSIDGIWIQDKQSYPLTFVLSTADTLWKHEGPAPLSPMSATADPAFEVATIKPSPQDAKQRSFTVRTRHFAARNVTVAYLIKFAYKVQDRQISDAPSWMNETKFDIAGEPDTDGLPSDDQYRVMLKKLLSDRFHLVVHSVHQIFPVYALTVEKNPPKLARSDSEFNAHGSIYVKQIQDEQSLIQFAGHTMQGFADILMNFIPDRQIVNETGLTGMYDFTLTVPSSLLPAPSSPPQSNLDENERAATLIFAVQSLGLKLAPKKASLEIIVIDHLEMPSAN